MGSGGRALFAGGVIAVVLAACAQNAPPAVGPTPASVAPSVAPSGVVGATPVGTFEGHLNPTDAVGGGANASNAVSNVASVFAAVQQASQLRLAANSSPPGATGPDVQSVSVLAQDAGGVLKGLDAAGKQKLGDSILTAAATAWPNASVSLLITDPAAGGGQIIGSRPKGGPNTVIAT
jgi:hypothetical protein